MLEPGTRLGPYEVIASLGAGGMGEVYKARDTGYWTRFAATGDPNSNDAGVVHWPAFKHPSGQGRGADKYIVLDWPIREDKRPRETACDFWEQFFFRSIAGSVPAAGD